MNNNKRKVKYSKEYCVELLTEIYKEYGRLKFKSLKKVINNNENLPSLDTIKRRFGTTSVEEIWDMIPCAKNTKSVDLQKKLPPKIKKKEPIIKKNDNLNKYISFSKDYCRKTMLIIYKKYGRLRKSKLVNVLKSNDNYPSMSTIFSRFQVSSVNKLWDLVLEDTIDPSSKTIDKLKKSTKSNTYYTINRNIIYLHVPVIEKSVYSHKTIIMNIDKLDKLIDVLNSDRSIYFGNYIYIPVSPGSNKNKPFIHEIFGDIPRSYNYVYKDGNHFNLTNSNVMLKSVAEINRYRWTAPNRLDNTVIVGVNRNKDDVRWDASIGYNDKKIWLGTHNTYYEAVEARLAAEEKYWGKQYQVFDAEAYAKINNETD